MKKSLKVFVAYFLSIIMMFTGVCADEIASDVSAHNWITSFLDDYYYAIEQYRVFNIKDYVDDEVLIEYITNKIKAKTYRKIVYGEDEIENLEISYRFIDEESYDNFFFYKVYSAVRFNYKGASFDSGYGEDIRITVQKDSSDYSIIDIYMYGDDYDMELREEELSFSECKNTYVKSINSEILSKQKELNKNIFKYYDDILNNSSEYYIEDKKDFEGTKASLHSLNRSSMVSWANTNCSKTNPSSGNSSLASYYDFSNIAGNYDCTNFVSHSILAGGSNIYQTNTSGISSTGWYYKGLNNRSSSWSGVPNLYSFLVNNTTKGPAGYKISYTNIYAPSGNFPYKAGDLLQFHNGSVWRHSTLIVGYIEVAGSTTYLEAIVTGRSSSGAYNYKQRQSSMYSGHSRRVIVMKGYYQ